MDGEELALNVPALNIPGGQASSDFLEISGSVQSGQKAQLTITFQLDGSGTAFAVNSYDDFYALTEPVVGTPTTDQGSTALLLLAGSALLVWVRKPGAGFGAK